MNKNNGEIQFSNLNNDTSTLYTIDSEAEFLIKIINLLMDKKYEMLKSQNKYANIDFILINKQNLRSVLIEHKKKSVSGADVPTFFIGYNKLIALDVWYKPPIYLVFECIDNIYWIEYDSSFLKRETKMVRGGKLVEINKTECGVGLKNLIAELKAHLNM